MTHMLRLSAFDCTVPIRKCNACNTGESFWSRAKQVLIYLENMAIFQFDGFKGVTLSRSPPVVMIGFIVYTNLFFFQTTSG